MHVKTSRWGFDKYDRILVRGYNIHFFIKEHIRIAVTFTTKKHFNERIFDANDITSFQ